MPLKLPPLLFEIIVSAIVTGRDAQTPALSNGPAVLPEILPRVISSVPTVPKTLIPPPVLLVMATGDSNDSTSLPRSAFRRTGS